MILTAKRCSIYGGETSPVTGREYALVGGSDKTVFVDMTTPNHPIYLGFLPTATIASGWRDLKVIGNYVYIVSEAIGHGLQVFDLLRIENLLATEIPVEFDADANYTDFGNCHNVAADTANGFIYAIGSNTVGGGLHILDISDPMNPVFAGSSSEAGYVHDAQIMTYTGPDADYFGREICVGFNEDRLVVYDVTEKTDIIVVSQSFYDSTGYTHQGWFTEDFRFLISNDEVDELEFDAGTRSFIWNMEDLDNPIFMNSVQLGTASIDHNLYINGDMVYMSNYTSGLRIFDLLDIAEGHLEPFGFFDVLPQTDGPFFFGTWSNYPYFESGFIPVSGISSGLHIVKANFFELETDLILACAENSVSFDFDVNRRLNGEVSYAVEMAQPAGFEVSLTTGTSDGAPFANTASFSGLSALANGNYPGDVVITYGSQTVKLPFVIVKNETLDDFDLPVLLSPEDGSLVPDQEVTFTFDDPTPGYVKLQIATDEEFGNIVYEAQLFGSNGSAAVSLPFDLSTYFWRLAEPQACGGESFTDPSMFTIDITASLESYPTSTIKLYPNPASDFLIIESEESLQHLRIFDVSGRTVFERLTPKGQDRFQLELHNFDPGIYFMTSSSGVGLKFVVQ